MQGKILKGISGFYYVHVVESGIYECKAKGIFRQQGIKPLVGDLVEIDIIDEAEKKGNITWILPFIKIVFIIFFLSLTVVCIHCHQNFYHYFPIFYGLYQ